MRKVLVIGGAKSGKTRFALRLGQKLMGPEGRGLYIATCEPLDQEMEEKVLLHKKERSKAWDTLEEAVEVWKIPETDIKGYSVLLLDCLTMWLLNTLEKDPNGYERYKGRLLDWFSQGPNNTIVVTNEIGLGIVPQDAYSRRYRDLLGDLNQALAHRSSHVYLVVAGIATDIKRIGGINGDLDP